MNEAIAAAVAAGGANLTAVAGTYCFSGPLTLPNGVTLTGASMASVNFQPTKSGAAFILQGTSGISSCTLLAQPGDNGYYLGAQDPTPTQRSLYATAGAKISLSNVSLASVDCIDCSGVSVQNCVENSTLDIFGSNNVTLRSVNFAQGYLNMFADSNQNPNVGVNLVGCTWPKRGGNQTACIMQIGGGIAKGAAQGVQGCNFANNAVSITIVNDKSANPTYFSFANNLFAGGSIENSLYLVNGNPNVAASINGNQFETVAYPGSPNGPVSAIIASPASQSDIGSVACSNNVVWAPVIFSGGRQSYTNNRFSNLGQLSCESGAWFGLLNISGNNFTLSGQTSNASNVVPILLQLGATDSQNVEGPITVQNNKCTSTVALPGYILLLDPANDQTNVSGNTVNPSGPIIDAVHTMAEYQAIWQQLLSSN
jgi:hypothetical protein